MAHLVQKVIVFFVSVQLQGKISEDHRKEIKEVVLEGEPFLDDFEIGLNQGMLVRGSFPRVEFSVYLIQWIHVQGFQEQNGTIWFQDTMHLA